MKKLLIIAGLLGVASGVFAQGTLTFANGAGGVNAPVTDHNGAKINAPNFVADLYYSTDTAAATSSLIPAGFNVSFSTVAGGGYFLGGVRTIAGVTGTIEAQVRVWDTATYSSYDAAKVGPGGEWGFSNPTILVTLATGATPPPAMTGLTGFQLTMNPAVPEPSTFALAGLGA